MQLQKIALFGGQPSVDKSLNIGGKSQEKQNIEEIRIAL